ncbi:MAG: hypothetical protein IKU57_05040, partial [Oscillospiraceae bacterium]|nr:hypothetical protein [Oscillospiraceae bacterium]
KIIAYGHVILDATTGTQVTPASSVKISAGSLMTLHQGVNGAQVAGKAAFAVEKTMEVAMKNDTWTVVAQPEESVIAELTGYQNWSTDNEIPFNVSEATKTALEATSWFVMGAGSNNGQWAKVTGKALFNGVERDLTIIIANDGGFWFMVSGWKTKNVTLVLPKDNVFTLVQACVDGTAAKGGQLQFAKNYEIKLTAGNTPVQGVVTEESEKVTAKLGAYQDWSTDNEMPFFVSDDTIAALEGTSWFKKGAGSGTGQWAKVTGKALFDGVEKDLTIIIASDGGFWFEIPNWKNKNTTIVLSKDSVFAVAQASTGATMENGGQLQFAKTYEIILSAGSKPVVDFELAAKEIVTAELGSYNGWGDSFIPFSVTDATKTALEATSWFVTGSGTSFHTWAKLTGKMLVDGAEQDCNITIANDGQILIDMAGWKSKNATIVLPKENTYKLTQACLDGTTENGGQLKFAETYTIVLQNGVVALVEADSDIELGFSSVNNAGHWYFTSDKTETELGVAYSGRFLKTVAEVDGKTVSVWLEHYGEGNLIAYAHVILDPATSAVVTPAESFKLKAGTLLVPTDGIKYTQIAGTRAFTLASDVNISKQNGIWAVVAKPGEQITAELGSYNGWGDDFIPFSVTDDTKTALEATSWFVAGSGTSFNTWAKLTGKMLVDGVEWNCNLTIANDGQILIDMAGWKTKNATIVLPEENLYLLTQACPDGTAENGGQLKFAETYTIMLQNGVVALVEADSDIELGFSSVSSAGHWYFTSDKTETELGAAYSGRFLKTVAEVDGKTVSVWLEHYGEGKLIAYAHVILDPSTSAVVTPVETFKLKAGTLLVPTNGIKHTQIAGTRAFTLATDVNISNQSGVWAVVAQPGEKVTVELNGYQGWGTDNEMPFFVSNATKTALEATSWFIMGAGSGSGQWARVSGKALFDGVEKDLTIIIANDGGLWFSIPGWKNKTATIVLPKDNVYILSQACTGGNASKGGQLQFAKTYEITLNAGNNPIVRFDLADNEIVTAQLGSYSGWGDTFIPFSVSDATKTALEGTSWFVMGSGTSIHTWAKLTGKMLVDGAEQDCNITIANDGQILIDMAGWKNKDATIVLPKENVYELTQACPGGTAINGGQLKFAETYTIVLQNGVVALVEADSDIELGFSSVSSAGHWYFTSDKTETELGAAYSGRFLKTVAEVDGKTVSIWLEHYGEGNLIAYAHVILDSSTNAVVTPAETFKLKAGTLLVPTDGIKYTQIAGTRAFTLASDVNVSNQNGIWAVDAQPGEKVTVELSGYQGWSTDDEMPFSVSDATKTALEATSWFIMGAGSGSGQWARVSGKALFDGVEQDLTIIIANDGGLWFSIPGWKNKTATIVLPKENVFLAYQACVGGTLANGGQLQFAETYTIVLQNGVVGIVGEDSKINLSFATVSDKNHWYFTTDKTEADLGEAYSGRFLKTVAEVDGKTVNVWLEHYGEGKLIAYAHVILDPATSAVVTPAESFKIKAGSLLIPTTGISSAQIADVKAFTLEKDVDISLQGGHWLDSNTPVAGMKVFYDRTADNDYWYFDYSAEPQPQKEAFLMGRAIVDGKEQTVFLHHADENRLIIYSQCFAEIVPEKSFQLKEGTVLVQYTAPNGSRVADVPAYRVTNDTDAKKAEGILWIGSSTDKPEQEAVDPIYATIEYAGNTQNMMWLKVVTDQKQELKEIYGNRKQLKGAVQVGLLNDKEKVTEYTLEGVGFYVLDGSLYVSAPGLNAVEMVHIEKGTVLIPASGANSDRAIIIKNTYHIERDSRDKWVSTAKALATDSPQTGDAFPVEILVTVSIVSLFGLILAYRATKKKKYE